MERSRKVFLKIASAAEKVIHSANKYADLKDRCSVQRPHFQLEAEMRRITVACECIVDILARSSLPDSPKLDIRLQDWLNTDEPSQCLDTLGRMERLLQNDDSSWIPRIFQRGPWGSAHAEDKIQEAAEHLASRKASFHFLLSTEIWNNEKVIQQQQANVQRMSGTIPKEIDSTVSDSDTRQGGCVDPITQGGLDILDQTLPVSTQIDHVSIPGVAAHQNVETVEKIGGEGKTANKQKQKEKQEKKLEEIVQWLDGLNCAGKQDDTLSLRQPSTCKWLFDTFQYKTWRGGEDSFLWLRGKPGAGKSVLASSVIDSLETSPRKGEILAFFYCDFRNERSTTSAEVLRSVLSQLLRALRDSMANPGGPLDDLIKAKERGGSTRKNAKELAFFISRVASSSKDKPLVVIDALDECKDIGVLLQALLVIRSRVRLFVTSRPLHAIMRKLVGLPYISMDDMNSELSTDIWLHVTRELDARLRLRDLSTGFKAEIRLVLCQKAGGMFRWIQCSIDALDRCMTRKEVRSALDNLPEGLDQTYERILLAIDMKRSEGRLARRALTWLVAAIRPLQLCELMEALSINLQTRSLDLDFGPMHNGAVLGACGSLVTHNEKTDIIILSHFSVKEYLMGELVPIELSDFHINWELANLELARASICYLLVLLNSSSSPNPSKTSPNEVDSTSECRDCLHMISRPLCDYMLNRALDHFRHLGSQFELVLQDFLVLVHAIRRYPRTWNNLCRSVRRVVDIMTPCWPISKHDLTLYMLIAFAPNSVLRIFLQCTGLEPQAGSNPLIYTAYFNKDEHARSLLLQGAKLNYSGWNIEGSFHVLPIEVALQTGHYTMVSLFVQVGSAIPPHIFTRSFFQTHPCCIPAPIMKMLLQTDDFVEAAHDGLNEVVLQPMQFFGYLLEKNGVNEDDLIYILSRVAQVVDPSLAHNLSILQFAVTHGYLSVAEYILSLGGSLPFHPFIGTASVIQPLVKICSTNKDSLLHTTLQLCKDEANALEATKFLIGYGCNPLKIGSSGETLLHFAVKCSFVNLSQYLLSLGVPLPPSILHTAFMQQWTISIPMLTYLLKSGAIVPTHNADGNPVLYTALQLFHNEGEALEVAKLLISHGCDPLEAGPSGETPLHIAVKCGLLTVTQYLLSLGVPLPPNILQSAFMHNSGIPMIVYLLKNGANVHTQDADGDPMLYTALCSCHSEVEALKVAKLLIDHGCNPLEAGPSGETPLHVAIEHNFVNVAQYFLDQCTSPQPNILDAPKLYEMQMFTISVLACLLENGINIHASNADRDSILCTLLWLCQDGDEILEVAKFLVARGCSLLKSSGETLLHVVIERDFVNVAQYLLSLGVPPPPNILHAALLQAVSIPMIICLLDNGANVHTHSGDPVLHTALQSYQDEAKALRVTKLFIAYGCEVGSCGKTLLHVAVGRNFLNIVQYLLSIGVPLSPNILWYASLQPHIPMLVCLLEGGADVHACSVGGDPVLCIAMRSCQDEVRALEVAKLLIAHGYDPLETVSSGLGETSLHVAVKRGFITVVRYLLSLTVPLPPSILHTVFMQQWTISTPMFTCLLENGANVHACNAGSDPVLHIALRSCHEATALSVAKLLITHGCDLREAGLSGETPFHVAVKCNFVHVVQYLLSLGAPPPPDILHALLSQQSITAPTRMLVYLLENGANVHARTITGDSLLQTTLQWFLHENHAMEIVKVITCHGCNPDEVTCSGQTPLHIAVERGFVSITRYLLSLGVPPTSDLLLVVFLRRDKEIQAQVLRWLEDHRNCYPTTRDPMNPTTSDLGSMREAFFILEILKLLINRGCSPLQPDSHGEIPLCTAAEQGHITIARILLLLCAPFNSPRGLLWVVLISKHFRRKLQTIEFLIDQGANVLEKAPTRDSLLHIAIVSINDNEVLQVVDLLLRRGCDPTAPNAFGMTPFHVAVERGRISVVHHFLWLHVPFPPNILFTAVQSSPPSSRASHLRLEIIKMLVTSGCDTQLRNAAGQTPLHVASSLGLTDVVDYLLSVQSPFVPPGGAQ